MILYTFDSSKLSSLNTIGEVCSSLFMENNVEVESGRCGGFEEVEVIEPSTKLVVYGAGESVSGEEVSIFVSRNRCGYLMTVSAVPKNDFHEVAISE